MTKTAFSEPTSRLKPLAISAAAFALLAPMFAPSAAFADPAPDAESVQISAAGAFQQVVPDGVCAVNINIAGAPGGVSISAGNDEEPDPDNPEEMRGSNGSGAVLGATVLVGAGETLTGVIGAPGGDGSGIGGAPGGGNGGPSLHRGAGGGGYSTVNFGSDLLLLAAGGGGTGGGHTNDHGWGGDAGAGQHDGVSLDGGTVYAGNEGTAGQDRGWNADPISAPGAGGGGATVGGLGGLNPVSVYDDSGFNWDGYAGSSLLGGNGGNDNDPDSGGGGGAGYFGGGGGASTWGQVGADGEDFVGGGGGGGSSYVTASDLVDQDSLELLKNRDAEGTTLNGYATFEWIMCDYDLSVTKAALGTGVFEDGDTVSYSVTVTNNGPDAMAIGDTVSVADDLAVGGTLISVDGLDTAVPAEGETITDAGLELYNLVGDDRDQKQGLAVGESVTLVYEVTLTGTEPVDNTVTITDRSDVDNNSATATVVPAEPSTTLQKSADTTEATTVGQKIVYSFLVTNTGNIVLHDVAIDEQTFSGKGEPLEPVCAAAPVEPEDSITCTATYSVVEADLTGEKLTNTATANAETPGGATVQSNESSADITTVKPVVVVASSSLAHTGVSEGWLGLGAAGLALLLAGAVALGVTRLRIKTS